MVLSKTKIHTLSWLLLNVVWGTILGLFLPRTPAFGQPMLAATIPLLLYGVFTVAARNTTKYADAQEQETAVENKVKQPVPPWVYGGITLAILLKNILQAVFDESLLKFLVLGILLGWPWFEITWRSDAYFYSLLGSWRSFLAAIGLSVSGISLGLITYWLRQEQVLPLFLMLISISIFCVTVISLIESPITKPKR